MKKQQKSKRHHFVPQCYLKNFIRDGNLYALDIRKVTDGIPHKVKLVQPAGICYIEDYYTIHPDMQSAQFKLDGLDELFVESNVLSASEDRYAKYIYPKLVAHDVFSREDACELADFILQLKFRNPFHFNDMASKMPTMVDEIFERFSLELSDPNHKFAHIPNLIKDAVINKFKERTKSDALFSKKMQLLRLAESQKYNPECKEKLRNAVVNADWWMLQSPDEGPFFITSDNPGFAVGKDGLNYNTKFKEGFAFYLPISPIWCLLITDLSNYTGFVKNDKIKTIKKIAINNDEVIKINDRAIQRVNKLLIASDVWYLPQIAEINRGKSSKF